MDWSIGMTLPNMQERPDPAVAPQAHGYWNILTVVEAKAPASLSRAQAQVLAYMGCLYCIREEGRSSRVYLPMELNNPEPQTHAKIPQLESETRIYDVTKPRHLKLILCHILFIIIRSYETLAPTVSSKRWMRKMMD